MNQRGAAKVGFPLALQFRGEANSPLNKALWVAHPPPTAFRSNTTIPTATLAAKKTFAFTRSTYLVQ